MNKPLKIGVFAFLGTFVGNLVWLFWFQSPPAAFFPSEWWDDWSAIYSVWIIFVVIGLVQLLIAKKSAEKNLTTDDSTS